MAQRVILPIQATRVNAGYKSVKYKQEWGWQHYGVDLGSQSGTKPVYAIGEGVVHSCGLDGFSRGTRLGNCIVVVYKDVLCNDGVVRDLACRMYHLESIATTAGAKVKAGTLLGYYGSTGANSSGPHLHIEFDTDIKYPQYAVGISGNGNVIKQGTIDSTVDPSKVWFVGAGQSITSYSNWISEGWLKQVDIEIPHIYDKLPDVDELEQLKAELEAQKAATTKLQASYDILQHKHENIIEAIRKIVSEA